jgi:hypothetical protein
VSPVKYEMGFYIPEDDILHSDRRNNLKHSMAFLLYHIAIWYLLCRLGTLCELQFDRKATSDK